MSYLQIVSSHSSVMTFLLPIVSSHLFSVMSCLLPIVSSHLFSVMTYFQMGSSRLSVDAASFVPGQSPGLSPPGGASGMQEEGEAGANELPPYVTNCYPFVKDELGHHRSRYSFYLHQCKWGAQVLCLFCVTLRDLRDFCITWYRK